ncbi:MAG: hypothetical protein LBM93_09475 [Oscillospiraceae bacterium]|jgi:hypothetical protein|nr:hypothetical protein [Oscillospiraceae bacterium]
MKTLRLSAMEKAARLEQFLKASEKRVVSVSVAVGSALALTVPSFAADPITVTDPFSGVDFSPILTYVTAALPSVMPVIVALVGIKKGIFFVLGLVAGA